MTLPIDRSDTDRTTDDGLISIDDRLHNVDQDLHQRCGALIGTLNSEECEGAGKDGGARGFEAPALVGNVGRELRELRDGGRNGLRQVPISGC